MRKVARSALVPFSAEQMFALVDDIERYPEFLPWCSDSKVHSRTAELLEATLSMSRAGVTRSFRTRNRVISGKRMTLELVDGPFDELAGDWVFEQLGNDGCRVSMTLDFQFDNPVVDKIFGNYLETACSKLIDAFTQRAADVYG